MDSKFDSLPKNVQKLVKKLAEIQRKRTAVFRENTKGMLRADHYAEKIIVPLFGDGKDRIQ